jgi:hypothetical protein
LPLIVGDDGFKFQLSDSFDGSEHKKKHSERQHKESPGEEGHKHRKGLIGDTGAKRSTGIAIIRRGREKGCTQILMMKPGA